MTEKRKLYILKKCSNDAVKIIFYVIFMTTLFMLYFTNEEDKVENTTDNFHSYFNKTIILLPRHGN